MCAALFGIGEANARLGGSQLAQLTLFPRVSKTTETKLRESRAIARKHFVKQCLLKNNESIVLTLMKGDEVVETVEMGSYEPLLLNAWHPNLAQ